MLNTLYHFELNHTIVKNQIVLGKNDGINTTLCFATVGGKVLVYSPNEKNTSDTTNSLRKDLNILNINTEITALCFGYGDIKSQKEYLFIGSPSSIICYDIQNNKTLFNKDVLDGIYCITTGTFANFNNPLCIAGGNCSIQGFDINGDEQFWTVTGGNTQCLSLSDVDEDNINELIVGTDDFAIRFYKRENNIYEINENNKINLIHTISNSKFVYGLENGTIGLYDKGERIWKKKEKGILTGCITMDINQDGMEEIICAWSSGKLQMRQENNGEILFELDLEKEIAKLLIGDLNNTGKKQIICCTTNGEIYGYVYQAENVKIVEKHTVVKDPKVEKEEILKYDRMLLEKKSIMENIENMTISITNKIKQNNPKDQNSLDSKTHVKIDLQSNNECKCADLIIESTVGTIIKCVVVVSEQLYKGETHIEYPEIESNKITIQIKNEKDMNINLHIKVLLGLSFFSKDYQVFEFNKIIPKYCFYILLRDEAAHYRDQLKQGVFLKVNERLERLLIWLEQNFNIPIKELSLFKNNDVYDIRFLSLRTDKILQIYMHNSTLKVMTDEIELAGNILQDMCSFFQILDTDTKTIYPDSVKELSDLIIRIEELDTIRVQYNINMAEIITIIKDLFVRAEDNRMLDNLQEFKEYFMKINIKNLELLDEFEKRSNTYEELFKILKGVNTLIQNFASLKVGTFRNKMISLCREAIRSKNYKLLIKVVSTVQE